MAATLTIGWIGEHYKPGFYMDDDGSIILADSPEWGLMHGPIQTINGYRERQPSRRVLDHARPTFICRTCGEPSWSVTCHAAERHGVDVAVYPPLPGKVRPEWMHAEWL